MLLVQPALPQTSDMLLAPLAAVPASSVPLTVPPEVVPGALVWPGAALGADATAGFDVLAWMPAWPPLTADAGAGVPAVGVASAGAAGGKVSEPLGPMPDFGGIALLLGGLLVLAGWRRARR